ncbi:MAG: pilus assembly protein TadG-related protein [Rhizobiaceae bacterium]
MFVKNIVTGFLRSNSGSYGILMGVMAFPLVGMAALALDYSAVMRDRGEIQESLDAAALATSKYFATGASTDELETYAQDFFEANLPNYIDDDNVEFSFEVASEEKIDDEGAPYTEKSIALNASLTYDTFVARVMGHDQWIANLSSAVAMGNITVEIAIVMDNSGSMRSNNRINIAKKTSKDLVEAIFNGAGASNRQDPVQFALVPFAASVNVGAENANARWLDRNGWATIHNENLDWDHTYVRPSNSQDWEAHDLGDGHFAYREMINGAWEWRSRFDIFDMLGVNWEGCVEMRPWPHNTQDTHQLVNSSNVDNVESGLSDADGKDALFVPLFAPAEPSNTYAFKNSSGKKSHTYDRHNYYNDYLYDWKRPKASNPSKLQQLYDNTNFDDPYDNGVISGNQNDRQNWVWRYQAAAIKSKFKTMPIGQSDTYGPNYRCTTAPIKELTTSQSDIKNAIDSMDADGMTNIQQGISWGWRMVSSREPFTQGREESDVDNRKFVIVLTDGNNTYGTSHTPNESAYGAWGYDKHGRRSEGLENADLPDLYKSTNINTQEKEMNAHTLQTCENAKADGVTVFTIAFDVSNGSSVKQLLDACAGSAIVDGQEIAANGQFYFDVNGGDLEAAMGQIAAQISDMRIIR